MWQPGETTHFAASDHVRVIHRHARGPLLDYAIVNIRPIPLAMKKKYARQAAQPVKNDIDALFKSGVQVMAGKLAQLAGNKVRHDPAASAAVVIKLALEGRRRRSARS
jgi:2-phospho-L-lactate transferase/gluconeogenesis factor (CofD/UPF0052 family)